MLPFAWTGVRLHAANASMLRVRITPAGSAAALSLADASGAPVASVESLSLRAVDPAQLDDSGAPRQPLLQVEWTTAPEAAPAAGWAVLDEAGLGLPAPLGSYSDLAGMPGTLPFVVAPVPRRGRPRRRGAPGPAAGPGVACRGAVRRLPPGLRDP